jgi:hypothetical protein
MSEPEDVPEYILIAGDQVGMVADEVPVGHFVYSPEQLVWAPTVSVPVRDGRYVLISVQGQEAPVGFYRGETIQVCTPLVTRKVAVYTAY